MSDTFLPKFDSGAYPNINNQIQNATVSAPVNDPLSQFFTALQTMHAVENTNIVPKPNTPNYFTDKEKKKYESDLQENLINTQKNLSTAGNPLTESQQNLSKIEVKPLGDMFEHLFGGTRAPVYNNAVPTTQPLLGAPQQQLKPLGYNNIPPMIYAPPTMSDQDNKMKIQKAHKQTQDFLNSIYKRGR